MATYTHASSSPEAEKSKLQDQPELQNKILFQKNLPD